MIVWIPLLVLALVFTTAKRKSSDKRRGDLGFVIVILVLDCLIVPQLTFS
jgi:hypothetical protein